MGLPHWLALMYNPPTGFFYKRHILLNLLCYQGDYVMGSTAQQILVFLLRLAQYKNLG